MSVCTEFQNLKEVELFEFCTNWLTVNDVIPPNEVSGATS